jgi:predicted nucleic acid-binding protein
MAQLIDSSVFIGLERRELTPDDLVAIGAEAPFAMSSVSASELLVGVHLATPSRRKRTRGAFVEEILTRLPILPFDLAAARTRAAIWAQLTVQGTPISRDDLMIAATALTHGFGVLTDNVRDFERVPGLVVRRPTWPSQGS